MLHPGEELHGRYIVEGLVGSGGMGSVYRAQDTLKDRRVALKEFQMDHLPSASSEAGGDDTHLHTGTGPTREQALEQFKREARMLSRLSHPNLPAVDDFFIIGGRGFIAMTYIEGSNLMELLNRQGRPFTEERVRIWLTQMLDVLEYCHSQEIFHRDLKPENILLAAADHIYIIDFGIAKSRAMTGTGTVLGARGVTVGFAPPEQYAGSGITDARTDLYALGATLYCLLTGRVPPESVERIAEDSLVAPRQLNPLLSSEMENLVLACLTLERSRRPASAQQIRTNLANPRGQAGAVPPPASPRPPIPQTGDVQDLHENLRQPQTVQPAGVSSRKPASRQPALPIGTTPFHPQRAVQLKVIKAKGGPLNDMAFSAAGRTLASAAHLEKVVRLWSVDSGECLESLGGFEAPVTSLAFSSSGRRLAAASEDKSIKIWDLDHREYVEHLVDRETVSRCLAFAPVTGLLASAESDGTVNIYNLDRSGDFVYNLNRLQGCLKVAFSPNGRSLAVLLDLHEIRLFNTADWNQTHKLNPGPSVFMKSLAFSPDGRLLASGTSSGIFIWDRATLKALRTLEGHRGDVAALAFSPDGAILASGSADHTIRLWNASNGRPYDILIGHDYEITGLAFSADGCLLASASKDGTLRLWGEKS